LTMRRNSSLYSVSIINRDSSSDQSSSEREMSSRLTQKNKHKIEKRQQKHRQVIRHMKHRPS